MNYTNTIITAALFIMLLSMRQNKPLDSTTEIYSQLWGKAGEKWDTAQLPDFTSAGYKSGKAPIPDFTVGVTVTDFGAVADGVTDNTEAFRNAIAACGPNQSVFIPSGTYVLKDTLVIAKSNISLSSDKDHPATLFFQNGLEQLYPLFNSRGNQSTNWSWSGGVLLFTGKINNVGVSNLHIRFPDSAWAGHDFHERGYNGIGFSKGVRDGWVKNITITGADVGFWIDTRSRYITVENWLLDFGLVRGARNINGHQGVNINGHHNLLQNFKIQGRFAHDLSVESKQAMYNVFRNGMGNDINIDHHNHGQSKNLFTNLDIGTGTRLYTSGGQQKPRGLCTYETFWNLTALTNMGYPDEKDNAEKHSTGNICVGIKTGRSSILGDAYGNWFETIEPARLYPKDLYLAQMQYINGK